MTEPIKTAKWVDDSYIRGLGAVKLVTPKGATIAKVLPPVPTSTQRRYTAGRAHGGNASSREMGAKHCAKWAEEQGYTITNTVDDALERLKAAASGSSQGNVSVKMVNPVRKVARFKERLLKLGPVRLTLPLKADTSDARCVGASYVDTADGTRTLATLETENHRELAILFAASPDLLLTLEDVVDAIDACQGLDAEAYAGTILELMPHIREAVARARPPEDSA